MSEEKIIWVSQSKRIVTIKHGKCLECDFQVRVAKSGQWTTRVYMSLFKDHIQKLHDYLEGA